MGQAEKDNQKDKGKKTKKTPSKKTSETTSALAVMGAPTKFQPAYTEMLLNFFNVEPYRKEEVETSVELVPMPNGVQIPKAVKAKYKFMPNRLPTLRRFAASINVDYTTVWRWADRGEDQELQRRVQNHLEGKELLHPEEFAKLQGLREFCKAYKEAKEMQKEFLIDLGLSGIAPSAAFIFTAKNITDMRDEQTTNLDVGEKLADLIAAASRARNKELQRPGAN